MEQSDFSRLEAIQQHIEDTKYGDFGNSLQLIYEEMIQVNAWKSFSGKMMAEYKRTLNRQKTTRHLDLIRDGNQLAPSIAKEFIASDCSEFQFNYDFAERVNSSCAYYLDSLRSILSSLKQELITVGIQH